MRRKVQKDPSSFGEQGDPIPTQEYIRRAVEEPCKEDEDFSRDPWISAVDYIRSEGFLGDDGVAIGTPVSVIKSGFGSWGKVNQVVAIVKTCTPNGLGDLMVTLKDPTGTMDASVHRKVLTESEFGRDIHVGAVLILKKVAVCTPTRLSCYLNITLNNISKVITRDTLPSLKQNGPVKSAKDPVPSIVENEKCLRMQPKAFSRDRGKTEGILNNLRQHAHASSETHTDIEMEDVNSAEGSDWHMDVTKDQDEQGVEQDSVRKQDSNSKTETAAAERRTTKLPQGQHQNLERQTQKDVANEIDTGNWEELLVDEEVRPEKQSHHSQQGGDMASCGTNCEKDATVTKVDKKQTLSTSSGTEVGKTQWLPSTTSVPEWTDEQLDELFAFE